MVPAMTMPAMLRAPVAWARWAAKGMMNSLGMGTNVLSIAMRAAIRG